MERSQGTEKRMTQPEEQSITSFESARAAFPRGLYQPENRFRFGIDALLLSCFATAKPAETVVDLGTGCGAAGFGLLLHTKAPNLRVIGVDFDKEMSCAAQKNASVLGLSNQFFPVVADVRTIADKRTFRAETIDRVIANPPYRTTTQGRPPTHSARAAARFEYTGQLWEFIQAASFLVKNKGVVTMVMLAERLEELLSEMKRQRLTPKRLCCVHGHAGAESKLILVEAIKNARSGIRIESPLILYEHIEAQSRLTQHAGAFCPFLACNPHRTHHTN